MFGKTHNAVLLSTLTIYSEEDLCWARGGWLCEMNFRMRKSFVVRRI